MKADLRDYALRKGRELGLPGLVVILDGRILERMVIAFDTDAKKVEVLAGTGPIHYALLSKGERIRFGNYRGLATETLRGDIIVCRRITNQAELATILPKD